MNSAYVVQQYLCHYIADDLSDDTDVQLYAQADMLARKFGMCSEALFTAHPWSFYSKNNTQSLNVADNDGMRYFFNFHNALVSAKCLLMSVCQLAMVKYSRLILVLD